MVSHQLDVVKSSAATATMHACRPGAVVVTSEPEAQRRPAGDELAGSLGRRRGVAAGGDEPGALAAQVRGQRHEGAGDDEPDQHVEKVPGGRLDERPGDADAFALADALHDRVAEALDRDPRDDDGEDRPEAELDAASSGGRGEKSSAAAMSRTVTTRMAITAALKIRTACWASVTWSPSNRTTVPKSSGSVRPVAASIWARISSADGGRVDLRDVDPVVERARERPPRSAPSPWRRAAPG